MTEKTKPLHELVDLQTWSESKQKRFGLVENMSSKSFRYLEGRRFWGVWGTMFLFWTLVSSVVIVQDLVVMELYPASHGHPLSWYLILTSSLPFFYTWFALTPLIFLFGRYVNFEWGRKIPLALAFHLISGLVFAAVHIIVISVLSRAFSGRGMYFDPVYQEALARFYRFGHFEVLVYWAILGIGFFLTTYESSQNQKLEATRLRMKSSELESQLAKAELDSLRSQLHPHFLFNTLNAISTLVESRPERAVRMIAQLGELLRTALDLADRQLITLHREIAITKLYLDIEQQRFPDTISLESEIEDGGTGLFGTKPHTAANCGKRYKIFVD